MKTLLLLAVALSTLSACSGRGDDPPEPAPATVRIDSAGIVVDTTTR
ncbi:MAG TPA: hypothetical protein VMN37_12720 [Gemmatimonadales bacterium]|nr:hypothetical protein [Gemmatimonadales bacterium]